MRFWLSAFVILFAIAELFDWITQVDSWQASGIWLVLGGMGLAAVSNGFGSAQPPERSKKKSGTVGKALSKAEGECLEPSQIEVIDRSDDSISFKVRPLKR